MTRFEGETFTIAHAGMTAKVEGLSGWRCEECGEVEFDPDSASVMRRPATNWCCRTGKGRAGNPPHPQETRSHQSAAARLTGGGHNAFSRYERGEAAPLPAVVNLFRLLDKHPELLKELASP